MSKSFLAHAMPETNMGDIVRSSLLLPIWTVQEDITMHVT